MVTARDVQQLNLIDDLDFMLSLLRHHRQFHDVYCNKQPGCERQALHYKAAMRAQAIIAGLVAQRVK